MGSRAIVVIGTRDEGEIGLIQSKGFKVIFLNRDIQPKDAWQADVPVECDLNDETAVYHAVAPLREKFEIHGVFTVNDYRVPLAAKLSEILGLNNFMSYEAALNCRNKLRTRSLLKQAGLGSTRFSEAKTEKSLVKLLKDFSFPVVIKPIDGSGSRGVQICHGLSQAIDAYRAIIAEPKNWVGQFKEAGALIEEYISGSEFSVEAATANRETRIIGITQKHLPEPPFTYETGHTFPAPLSCDEKCKIQSLIKQVHQALGIAWGVTHTEIRSSRDGYKVIEVNGRVGGGKIRNLVMAATGYDLYEIALHILTERNVAFSPQTTPVTDLASIKFLYAKESTVVRTADYQKIFKLPGLREFHLDVEDGTRVNPTRSNFERFGYYIVHGKTSLSGGRAIC